MLLDDIVLNSDNFLFLAIKFYQNPKCNGISDLKEDLSIFKNTNKHLNKYRETGELSERLLLNNIIILHNVWGQFTSKIIFFKIKKKNWPQIKTVLVYLDRMPEYIYDGERKVYSDEIPLDDELVARLREI